MSYNDFIVDGKIINCISDKDCPYSSVCYYFNPSNITNGQCGCSLEYGDIGALCNQQSAMTYTRVALMAIASFLAFMVVVYIIYELFKIHADSGLKKLDVKVTTLIECALYELFVIIFNIGGILTLVHHEPVPIVDSVTGRKKRSFFLMRNAGTAGLVLFLVAGLLNVSVLWLEVAIASKKFKKISNPQVSKSYQKVILVFDIIFVVLAIVLNWFNPSLIGIVGAVLIILICIVYSYSAYLITVLVESHGREQSKIHDGVDGVKRGEAIKETLLRIRKTAISVVVLLVAWLLSLIVFSIGYSSIFKKYYPYGSIIYYFIIADIGVFSSIAAVFAVVIFVTKGKNKGSVGQITSQDDFERNSKSVIAQSSGVVVAPHSSGVVSPQIE